MLKATGIANTLPRQPMLSSMFKLLLEVQESSLRVAFQDKLRVDAPSRGYAGEADGESDHAVIV